MRRAGDTSEESEEEAELTPQEITALAENYDLSSDEYNGLIERINEQGLMATRPSVRAMIKRIIAERSEEPVTAGKRTKSAKKATKAAKRGKSAKKAFNPPRIEDLAIPYTIGGKELPPGV